MVVASMIARITPLKIRDTDGGMRVECEVSPRPGRRWRKVFTMHGDGAFGYFSSIRVSGSKLIAGSHDDADVEELTVAIDIRIARANLRASAGPSDDVNELPASRIVSIIRRRPSAARRTQ